MSAAFKVAFDDPYWQLPDRQQSLVYSLRLLSWNRGGLMGTDVEHVALKYCKWSTREFRMGWPDLARQFFENIGGKWYYRADIENAPEDPRQEKLSDANDAQEPETETEATQ